MQEINNSKASNASIQKIPEDINWNCLMRGASSQGVLDREMTTGGCKKRLYNLPAP